MEKPRLEAMEKCVAIKDFDITIVDLSRMVNDDDLGSEVGSFLGRVIL